MSTSKVKTTSQTRGFLEWAILRPLAWQAAGLRDKAATAAANRKRDIVR